MLKSNGSKVVKSGVHDDSDALLSILEATVVARINENLKKHISKLVTSWKKTEYPAMKQSYDAGNVLVITFKKIASFEPFLLDIL